ncbi:OmpH family outer membrane protein [Bacteroidales bacterium OttesenSCG-928-M11]|nr:OmpH family outer membrane protein [Bacteroidales bacterium OttesenSCG-928-M11]
MEEKNKPITNYIISGTLAVAIIVLYVLHFMSGPSDNQHQPPKKTQTVTLEDGTVVEQEFPMLPIAYVQSDSIYTSYKFFVDRSTEIQDKYQKSMSDLQSSDARIQQDYVKLGQEVQNNRYLTREDVEQREISIQRRYEELQKKARQVEQEYQGKVMDLNRELADSVQVAIEVLNSSKRFQFVFMNQGLSTILYAEDTYNITDELLDLLNSRSPSTSN